MRAATARALEPATEAAELECTWRVQPGVLGWLSAAEHHAIGRRFLVTAFGFFLAGGVLAALMRLQLAWPENRVLGPDLYNQVFTMHGTTMMFLFAVPVMEGLGVYLVPMMVGARNLAFPRLNAYSYWVYLFGGLMLYAGFFLNVGPDAGWFSYVPLAGPEFSPGKRVDFWAQMITFTELSALAVAIEIIVTVLKLRTPGMSLDRIPVFVWAMAVMSFMVVFAMPSVMFGSTSLLLDRLVGTHFYNPSAGGDPMLWQHLFWFFGHPEVYIIFVPATGVVSTVIATFTGRPIFGYRPLVLSLVATGFIAFGLWVHHMFTTGIPQLASSFFTAATLMIVIPNAVQIFCWVASLFRGPVRLASPMIFVLGFFAVFVMGGLTGVMMATVPFDIQVHDSFFVVAHFHYVLIGGAVFPLLAAVHYWFPKVTGRLMDERAARWTFWLFFVGFNLTFFPMHTLGFRGMPRRVYTYPADVGWTRLNQLAGLGAILMTAGALVLIVNLYRSRRRGAVAGDNPWNAATLEWATTSPPPPYNFLRMPVVASRDPLWETPRDPAAVVGLRSDVRDVLVTHVLDAEPDHRTAFPSNSIWPLLAALATTAMFVGSIFSPWAVVWGAGPLFATIVGWFWPKPGETRRRVDGEDPRFEPYEATS